MICMYELLFPRSFTLRCAPHHHGAQRHRCCLCLDPTSFLCAKPVFGGTSQWGGNDERDNMVSIRVNCRIIKGQDTYVPLIGDWECEEAVYLSRTGLIVFLSPFAFPGSVPSSKRCQHSFPLCITPTIQ